MATETENTADGGFGRVSRVRGISFKYATLLASVSGLLALGVLLTYVAWDAFGLASAELAWYACLVGFVVLPMTGFVLYAGRNPVAGTVALELVSTATGGVLAGFGAMAVLDIIAGPDVWFAYFLTVVVPTCLVLLYGQLRTDVHWTGLVALGVLLVGPVVGTVFLEELSSVATQFGAPGVYYLSLVVPTAAVVRYVVGDYLELGNGNTAAVALLVAGVLGVPLVDRVDVLTRSVWLIFLVSFVVPTTIVVGKNLAVRERWPGFAGPLAFLAGIAALALVPRTLDIVGPSPWFDWQFVTSSPSRFPEQAGLYPAIIGSVFIIVLVALITLFLGIGAAVFLEEYAPSGGLGGKVTRLIRINISNLAGVPSVVYGILGLAIFANILGLGFGTVITAAMTLSLLILPIVIISAREAINSVPDSLRNASYGMGATRWQTTRRVVLPRAIPGILTGTILALGRAIGETAPLIMIGVATTKFDPPDGLFSETAAMPMQIFAWSDYAQPAFQTGVVAAGVVTLLVVLLTMNSIAIVLRNRFEQEEF